MLLDSYYNYINLIAFKYLYKYENQTSLSAETLKLLRSELLKEVIVNYKKYGNNRYSRESDHWYGEITFRKVDEDIALKDFLEEYEEYFYLDNGLVHMRQGISFEDISNLVSQLAIEENVPTRLDIVERSKKIRNILGISTFDKLIGKYLKIEEKLQALYYKLFTPEDGEELRRKIKSLLFLRLSFYENLTKLPHYVVDAIKMAVYNYYE